MTRSRLHLTGLAMVTASALAAASSAQVVQRTTVVDDGNGPVTTSSFGFAPSFGPMGMDRGPEYARDDLPLFVRYLALDDVETQMVLIHLETYLEAFRELSKKMGMSDMPMMLGMPQMMDGANNFVIDDLNGMEGLDGIDIDFGGAGDDVEISETTTENGVIRTIRSGGGDGDDEAVIRVAVIQADGADAGGGGGGGVIRAGDGTMDVDFDVSGLSDEIMEQIKASIDEVMATLEERMGDLDFDAFEPADFDMDSMMERMEEMRKQSEQFAKARTLLGEDFMNAVQADLDEDGLARWPRLERALTRKKTLPTGRLDGERTDLVATLEKLDDVDIKEGSTLAQRLEAYEVALHDALIRRNEFVPKAQETVDTSMQSGDMDAALSAVDKATRLRVAVRRTNESYVDAIADALDEQQADAFRTAVLETSYPRVFRPTTAMKAFEKARRFDDITEEQRIDILEIENRYRIELAPLNEKIRASIRENQPDESRRRIEGLQAMMQGAMEGEGGGAFFMPGRMGEDDPTRPLFDQRTALDETHMTELFALLNDEQIKRLPKLPSQRVRRFQGLGDIDFGDMAERIRGLIEDDN